MDRHPTPGNSKGSQAQERTESTLLKTNKAEQDFYRHITLGIEEKLKSNRMIKDIKLIIRNPVEKTSLACWERKHGVSLPMDLKDYYSSTNGFKLTWALEHAGDLLRIGDMNINILNQLLPIMDNTSTSNTSNQTKDGSSTQSIMQGYYQENGIPQSSSNPNNSSSSARKNVGTRKGDMKRNDSSTYPQIFFEELQQTINSNATNQSANLKLIPELTLGPKGKAFVLESVRLGWGRVCLVYPNLKTGNEKDAKESKNKKDESSILNDASKPKDASQNNVAKIVLPSMSSSLRVSPKVANSITTTTSTTSAILSSDETPKTPVISPPTVEIWFLDPSFQWHYLAPTFTHYYRMLLIHLGLPQWHFRFTPYGLSAWAEQIFWLVAPHLLQPPKISKFPSLYHDGGLWSTDVPAEAAAPNPTKNVLSSQLFRRKKKEKPQ